MSDRSPLERLPLLQAMRPHQWVKNIFVLAPLPFALAAAGRTLPAPDVAWRMALALLAFCLGSSAIYLINDVADVESDRLHPEKRHRPIAAGRLAVRTALLTSVGCVAGALACAWGASADGYRVFLVVATYMTINLFYSFHLKHIAIVDAFCIAAGFLLRVLGGAGATGDPVSHWLMLCTLFLALFLALCKRRAEIDLLGDERGGHRKILLEYTPAYLDQAAMILAACTIICYAMYTVADDTTVKFGESNGLVWTVPFVVFGLLRYLLLVQTQRGGGSPTKVLLGGDGVFLANGLLWLATVLVLLFR